MLTLYQIACYTLNIDKQIRDYYETMLRRIDTATDKDELRRYHYQRLAEFQHERLVHLLVTLFFGFLTVCFVGLLLWTATLGVPLLAGLAGLLALIVAVTEGLYIAYYYRLENGVQRLYEITEKLK